MGFLTTEKNLNQIPNVIKDKLDDTHLVFPGFVNAHDHLDFNLFPLLTTRFYNDYIEWGADLHDNHKEEIEKVLKVSLRLRLRFGILKNLINGFTSVVHHGDHHSLINSLTRFPVWLDYQYIHSIATDRMWKIKLNLPMRDPIMIHLGEGKSEQAINEIDRVVKANFWKRDLVAVHALSMNPSNAGKFKAVVWCPDSNLNLYNATLDPASIADNTQVLFGTDSTLSSSANAWEHYRRALKLVSSETLFKILTHNSHNFFSSRTDCWVVAKKTNNNFFESFFQTNPGDVSLVWINGESWLCDDSFELRPKNGSPICVGNNIKWVHPELADVISSLEKLNVALPLGLKSA